MARKNKSLPKKFRLYFYGFWVLFLSGITVFSGIFYAASLGYLGEMPDFRQLENPNTNLASQIISSDNKVLLKRRVDKGILPGMLEFPSYGWSTDGNEEIDKKVLSIKDFKRSFTISKNMIEEVKEILTLFGIPIFEGESEADPYCAVISNSI